MHFLNQIFTYTVRIYVRVVVALKEDGRSYVCTEMNAPDDVGWRMHGTVEMHWKGSDRDRLRNIWLLRNHSGRWSRIHPFASDSEERSRRSPLRQDVSFFYLGSFAIVLLALGFLTVP